MLENTELGLVMFEGFPKIPRLNRDIVITEKIDGTNGCLVVSDEMELLVQSRNRFITPERDNFGFARWAAENVEQLVLALGPGRHFGEWWGPGIQRGYGLAEKRFSLFNTHRWGWLANPEARTARPEIPQQLSVVPVLYEGPWVKDGIWTPQYALTQLALDGSAASPGFMRPEGIVVFHTAGSVLFKATLEGDAGHKGDSK